MKSIEEYVYLCRELTGIGPLSATISVQAENVAAHEKGWTQAQLAKAAKVSRKFISDIEGGHPRAELGKTIGVLAAVDIHALAPLSPPPGRGEPIALDDAFRQYHE